MKLRNKKTGEITECCFVSQSIQAATVKLRLADQTKYLDPACDENDYILGIYNTLAELNEEWEDYKLKEPLIKDEKIRKAVRAWAEMHCFEDKMIRYMELQGIRGHYLSCCLYSIDIPDIDGLADCGYYTIAELCGDEE